MSSPRILLIFAHPLLEKSRVNTSLVSKLPEHKSITFRDLYELYPDFNVHVEEEKELLLEHDIIVWHHPFYWYSCPPLLKQWIDQVLEAGWAYGPGGNALRGKKLLQVITAGSPPMAYTLEGHHQNTLHTFLAPFRQTAKLCHMEYMPPFVVQSTHRLNDEEVYHYSALYRKLFEYLLKGEGMQLRYEENQFINDWLEQLISQ